MSVLSGFMTPADCDLCDDGETRNCFEIDSRVFEGAVQIDGDLNYICPYHIKAFTNMQGLKKAAPDIVEKVRHILEHPEEFPGRPKLEGIEIVMNDDRPTSVNKALEEVGARRFKKDGTPYKGTRNEILMAWAMDHENEDYCIVKRDRLPEGSILSTIWTGMDTRCLDGAPPEIFETKLLSETEYLLDEFGDLYRYSTEEDAIHGHEAAIIFILEKLREHGVEGDPTPIKAEHGK